MITKIEAFSVWPAAPELPLGGFMPNDDPVQVRNVDGLGPVKADITSTPSGTGRGEVPQGNSVGKRNIVLTLGLNPDWAVQTVASLRQMLYAYFMPQQWCKLRFFSDELPTVDIEGTVESFEPNIFSEDPEIQISIICLKPDFIEVDATIFYGVVDDGTNELEFDYVGSQPTGFELRVDQTADLAAYTGPLTVVMKSPIDPQTLEVNPVTINGSKYFKLSSVPSAKRVQNIALADGTPTSLLAKMTDDSVWPQLNPGKNYLSVAASTPGQAWTLAFFNRFGGL